MTYRFETSGKIKAPSMEALKAADAAGETVIVLDRGTLQNGAVYWAYVSVKPSRYREFLQLGKERKPKRLTDYGAILLYGFDPVVPESVKAEMKRKHGFDENYLAQLSQEARAARIQFLKQQEN